MSESLFMSIWTTVIRLMDWSSEVIFQFKMSDLNAPPGLNARISALHEFPPLHLESRFSLFMLEFFIDNMFVVWICFFNNIINLNVHNQVCLLFTRCNVAVTMLYCSLRSLLCSRKVIAPYCLSLFGPLYPDLIQTNKRTSSETANQN